MHRTPIRVVLELYPDTDPLQGRLCAPGQPARTFSGWLALAEAITAIHTATPSPEDVARPGPPQHQPAETSPAAMTGENPTRPEVPR